MSGGVTRTHKGVAYTSEVTLDRNTCVGCDLVGENCGAFTSFEGCGPAYQDDATDEKPCIIWIKQEPLVEVQRASVNHDLESRILWREVYTKVYFGPEHSFASMNRERSAILADEACAEYAKRFF